VVIVALLCSDPLSMVQMKLDHGVKVSYEGKMSFGTHLRVLAAIATMARTARREEIAEAGKDPEYEA
jgi:hypothetical protein